jgi:hypothetical protein
MISESGGIEPPNGIASLAGETADGEMVVGSKNTGEFTEWVSTYLSGVYKQQRETSRPLRQ